MLGLWNGNPVKLDCDDHYTTTDVINSLNNKKITILKIYDYLFIYSFYLFIYSSAYLILFSSACF